MRSSPVSTCKEQTRSKGPCKLEVISININLPSPKQPLELPGATKKNVLTMRVSAGGKSQAELKQFWNLQNSLRFCSSVWSEAAAFPLLRGWVKLGVSKCNWMLAHTYFVRFILCYLDPYPRTWCGFLKFTSELTWIYPRRPHRCRPQHLGRMNCASVPVILDDWLTISSFWSIFFGPQLGSFVFCS